MNESSIVTMNRTRIVGTARSRSAARASDAIPETKNVLVRAASIAGPVLRVESAVPSQETNPPAWAIDGTFVQSIGMRTNGQLAAIQPIVPQTRILPKSFWASFRFANEMAFVTDRVGT